MNRSEILQQAKPILFNTEMVRAILDGRKTVTRRAIKHDIDGILSSPYHQKHPEVPDKTLIEKLCLPPHKKDQYLYVRETWSEYDGIYIYKTHCRNKKVLEEVGNVKILWCPSIRMPKEAARIFLRVTYMWVERLQEITWQQAADEGCYGSTSDEPDPLSHLPTLKGEFKKLWNSTLKKSDLDRYGWDADPWVWVIEFERVEL